MPEGGVVVARGQLKAQGPGLHEAAAQLAGKLHDLRVEGERGANLLANIAKVEGCSNRTPNPGKEPCRIRQCFAPKVVLLCF